VPELTLIPNGDNTVALVCSSGTVHYALVDDPVASPDDLGTYVYKNGASGLSAATDLFDLPNHGTEAGAINYVRVYHRHRSNYAITMYSQPYVRMGVTDYAGTQVSITMTWTTNYTEWATNPNTSVAWTWTDIDNLIAGVKLTGNSVWTPEDYSDPKNPIEGYWTDYAAMCTQVYVVVGYTSGWSGKMSGVASPAKVMGVAAADIAAVKGVT